MPRTPQTARSTQRQPAARKRCDQCGERHSNLWRHIKSVHKGIKRTESLCFFCDAITTDATRSSHIANNHFPNNGKNYCKDCCFTWTAIGTGSQHDHRKVCATECVKGGWIPSRFLGILVRPDLDPKRYLKYFEKAAEAQPDWAASLHTTPLPFGVNLVDAIKSEIEEYYAELRTIGSAEHHETLPPFPPHPAPIRRPHDNDHTLHSSQLLSTQAQAAHFQYNPQDAVAFSSLTNIGTSQEHNFGHFPFQFSPPVANPYLSTPAGTHTSHSQAQSEQFHRNVDLDFFPLSQAPPAPASDYPSNSHTFSLGRSLLPGRKAAIYGML